MADGVHNKQWTCHKCYGVFPNGWNRHHHVRQCLRLGGYALTEVVSEDIRAGSNEAEAAADAQFETREVDTATLFGQEVLDERIDDQLSDAEVQNMRLYTQNNAKSHIVTSKDLEILMGDLLTKIEYCLITSCISLKYMIYWC